MEYGGSSCGRWSMGGSSCGRWSMGGVVVECDAEIGDLWKMEWGERGSCRVLEGVKQYCVICGRANR